jgi:hypothetical protein
MATTTSVGSLVSLFSFLPVILIVSSTILLDYAMRYEKLLHRCQIQIWMWLALSLASSTLWPVGPTIASGNDDYDYDYDYYGGTNENSRSGNQQVVCFAAWAHLTVFFNLSAILAEALQSRLNAPSRWNQNFRNALQILPMASWWSMIVVVVTSSVLSLNIYTTTNTTGTGTGTEPSSPQIDSVWKLSLWTFLGSFLVLWLIRISANRRRKNSIDMQGMPSTMTTTTSDSNNGGGMVARCCGIRPLAASANYNSSVASAAQFNYKQCWLDEGQWYTWNRVQTIQWFARHLSSSSKVDNDDVICEEEKDMVVAILAPHRITGDVLESLADVSQLVALRVPFGPACRLSDSITELVEQYPTPQRRTTKGGARGRTGRVGNRLSTNNNSDNNDTRSQYDDDNRVHSELRVSNDYDYNNNEQGPPSSRVPGGQDQYQNIEQQHAFQGGVSEEQHEKLNNVMKERFGLELPKLKATDWLAVQKGLRDQANKNNHETMPLTNNDMMSQPHPFAATTEARSVDPTMRNNDYANGTAVPLPQKQRQFLPNPSSSIDNNGTIPPSSMPYPSIPEHILEGMPPKIREITKRRPDLIGTIWNQNQNQVLQQQPRISPNYQASTALPGATKQFTGLHALPEIIREESTMMGEDTGDEDYDDSDDEDERTSLINNKDNSNEFPALYKSIDKSMIPSIV